MTEVIFVLITIYVLGAVVWGAMWAVEWSVEKHYNPDSALKAARMFLATPMWPVVGFALLLDLIAAMKRTLTEMREDARR